MRTTDCHPEWRRICGRLAAAIRSLERRTGGHLPILAITASELEEDRPSCLAAGMDKFVTKPVNREALLAALRRHVQGNREDGS